MQNLTRASRELFSRSEDECFESLSALSAHCRAKRERSQDRWHSPTVLATEPVAGNGLMLTAGGDGAFLMNDWSFSQLCKLSGVGKETVNRLSPNTAACTDPRGLDLLRKADVRISWFKHFKPKGSAPAR